MLDKYEEKISKDFESFESKETKLYENIIFNLKLLLKIKADIIYYNNTIKYKKDINKRDKNQSLINNVYKTQISKAEKEFEKIKNIYESQFTKTINLGKEKKNLASYIITSYVKLSEIKKEQNRNSNINVNNSTEEDKSYLADIKELIEYILTNFTDKYNIISLDNINQT